MAARKKVEPKIEEEVVKPFPVDQDKRVDTIKYRCDFKSYAEYDKYKGVKG